MAPPVTLASPCNETCESPVGGNTMTYVGPVAEAPVTVYDPSAAVVDCASPAGSIGGAVAPTINVDPTTTVAPAIALPGAAPSPE